MRKLPICLAALLTLSLATPAVYGAGAPPPACIAGTERSFAATGALQTYSVPAGATALLITANGASGGLGGAPRYTRVFPGGLGAHLIAGVPVSGVTTLDVVVGKVGPKDEFIGIGGGGGGGSFVFTPGGMLLVAAGGGGGADVGIAGGDAQLGTSGASGGSPVDLGGSGGTLGSGGGGGLLGSSDGGGGGGFLGAGGDGPSRSGGKGGHQVSPPGDAAGGAGALADYADAGGFGGGGGPGSGFSGGGGGGYSGGGGGAFGPGGGGSSFVAAGGTTFASSLLDSPGDGSVTICATPKISISISIPDLPIPTLSSWGLLLLITGLGGLGAMAVRRRLSVGGRGQATIRETPVTTRRHMRPSRPPAGRD